MMQMAKNPYKRERTPELKREASPPKKAEYRRVERSPVKKMDTMPLEAASQSQPPLKTGQEKATLEQRRLLSKQ